MPVSQYVIANILCFFEKKRKANQTFSSYQGQKIGRKKTQGVPWRCRQVIKDQTKQDDFPGTGRVVGTDCISKPQAIERGPGEKMPKNPLCRLWRSYDIFHRRSGLRGMGR